jgi:prepilin-type N-terminal cleavage/methylation domain-containing protein
MKNSAGFTMIELLVTLVLLGLIASLAAPGLESWLRSRQSDALRIAFSSEMALLPLQANRQGKAITLSNSEQLNSVNLHVEFIKPVEVLANGYCLGGNVALLQNNRLVNYDVLAPFCEVRRREQP